MGIKGNNAVDKEVIGMPGTVTFKLLGDIDFPDDKESENQ